MKNKVYNITIYLFFLIGLIGLFFTLKGISSDYNTLSMVNDSLILYKKKDSLNRVKTGVLQDINTKNLLSLKTKDKEIQDLQKIVFEYKRNLKNKGNVTILKTEVKTDIKEKTIILYDTIYKLTKLPTYKTKFNKKDWILGNIEANEDSVFLNLVIKNKYAVILGEEKKSIFSKNNTFVEVINYNPYSEVKTLRTFEITNKIKPKKYGLGFNVGYGLNKNLELTPYIGIGLNYNLIRF